MNFSRLHLARAQEQELERLTTMAEEAQSKGLVLVKSPEGEFIHVHPSTVPNYARLSYEVITT